MNALKVLFTDSDKLNVAKQNNGNVKKMRERNDLTLKSDVLDRGDLSGTFILSNSATQQLSNSATQQLSNSATQQLSNSATQQLSNSAITPS